MSSTRTLRPDIVERIGCAVVQHGPYNDRAYLMEQGPCAATDIGTLLELSERHSYGKLVACVGENRIPDFLAAGFRVEARAFPDADGFAYCSRFEDAGRARERDPEATRQALDAAREAHIDRCATSPDGYEVRVYRGEDLASFARLFEDVFPSYPFPIHEQSFLARQLAEDTLLIGAWRGHELEAAASAELHFEGGTAEMTDFAVARDSRGRGLASVLLQELENAVRARGIRRAYTIARASSAGMNVVFARRGYEFGGTLVTNTHISGSLESMNVWYRSLAT